MNTDSVPPWLRSIWAELTKPPAILRRDVAQTEWYQDQGTVPSDANKKKQPTWRSNPAAGRTSTTWSAGKQVAESPTDPPLAPRQPGGSIRSTERLAQKYFIPRVTRRPASLPRPNRIAKSAPRKRSKFYSKPTKPRAYLNQPQGGVSARKASLPLGQESAAAPSQSAHTDWQSRSQVALRPVTGSAAESVLSSPLQNAMTLAYNESIMTVKPADGVWRVVTDSGRTLALKQTTLPPERVTFIADALDELHRRGFTHTARIIRTQNRSPYLVDTGNVYYAMEWLAGTPAKLSSTRQTGAAARTLARLHEASKNLPPAGFQPPDACAVFEHLQARQQDMLRCIDLAMNQKTPDGFNLLVREQAEIAKQDAEQALALIKLPEAEAHLKQCRKEPGLCHLDVTSRHLLVHPAGHVQLIDFDLMTFGPRILDLAHLIRRAMQASGSWTSESAIAPLIAYSKTRPLAQGEYILLEALLTFPHRFWRQLRLHADQPAQAPDALQQSIRRLRETVRLEEERHTFLQTFSRQVTRRKPS